MNSNSEPKLSYPSDLPDESKSLRGFVREKPSVIHWIWVLGILAILIILMRSHTYREPLERDITTYAVIGNELLAGRELYSDLWDHKPPAIYMTYAAAIFIFGYGRLAVFLLGVAAALITMMGIFLAIYRLSGKVVPALWGSAFWAIECSSLELQANQPNGEIFINASLVWAFVLLLYIKPGAISWRLSGLAGILFAMASLYKQIALLCLFTEGLVFLWISFIAARSLWKGLANLGLMAGAVALCWIIVFGYFASAGRFQPFYDATVVFNRFYGGNILENLIKGFQPKLFYPYVLSSTKVMLPFIGVGLVFAFLRPLRHASWLWIGYLVAIPFMVAMPGQFYSHYYQLWIPPLSIGAGWGIAQLRRISKPFPTWASLYLPLVTFLLLTTFEAPYYLLPAEKWSLHKYGNRFIETEKMGRKLGETLKPNETFYNWGWESGLYFASQRRPPSGIFSTSPLWDGPLKDKLAPRLISDLEHTNPEIFIITKPLFFRMQLYPQLIQWVRDNYRFFPQSDQGLFLLLIRRGGRLEREGINLDS